MSYQCINIIYIARSNMVAALPMPSIAAQVVASVLECVRVQEQAHFDTLVAYNGGRYIYGDGDVQTYEWLKLET